MDNLNVFLLQGALTLKDSSCESVATSSQHHLTSQHPPRDASPAGLLSIAGETLTEFFSKATGTAIEWVQMPGMKYYLACIAIWAVKISLQIHRKDYTPFFYKLFSNGMIESEQRVATLQIHASDSESDVLDVGKNLKGLKKDRKRERMNW
ncbi:hypothetical protein POM88_041728 [Heracleum sosnowskyi]|uniref:Uncharacterized protein n=1 Tax=Heracleum sosnowskyi TaxID=360622 RepID=A0AAD8MAZ5_9APIA|nr:hypothetical protein POM88_041728 [Heracleum sosnowskyi]